jgi:pyocin large subunit-like protein
VYIGQTVPFASPYLLQIHFERHRHEFGVADEQEYERMADRFMSQPPNADLFDGTCLNPRANGSHDRLRLHGKTRWFGVAYEVLTVRTLFVQDHREIREAGGPRAFVDLKCLETF